MPRQSQRSQTRSATKSTQQTLEESLINVNVDDLISDLVHYIVSKGGDHTIFKRSDLKKNVLSKAGPHIQTIIDRTIEVLKDVCISCHNKNI